MTTATKTASLANTNILTITFVALLGATMVFLAGHAQSAALHDAAHDVRHSSGFPCH
jgi:cobalt transporter subunit CbtB